MRTWMAVAALVAVGLAGCAEDAPDKDMQEPDPDAGAAFLEGTLPQGKGARDFIESYVMTHPFRYASAQTASFMDAARDGLVTALEASGQNVTRQDYDGGQNILAIQEGTTHPEQWVVISAHYDTVVGVGATVYGAWDDGSGVGALLELARAYADWEFPFTVVYAFFDGEEKGLVGSRMFVQAYDPTEQDEVDLVANINMDPPGLNWPCGDQTGAFPVKIIHETDRIAEGNRYAWLFEAVEHGLNATEVPAAVRDYSPGIPIATVEGDGVTGSSDHVNFGAVGVANVFLGGTPTTYATGGPETGGTAALTYPLHTPLDTLEAMEARCTVGSLAGGLETTVSSISHALSWMAQNPVPAKGAVS